MELTIHNKQNGLDYTLCGDFYLPNLLPSQTEEKESSIWGMRHLRYIKRYRKVRYINLLTTGKLNTYLAEIDARAQKMKTVLIKQMSEHEGVNDVLNEALKTTRIEMGTSEKNQFINRYIKLCRCPLPKTATLLWSLKGNN